MIGEELAFRIDKIDRVDFHSRSRLNAMSLLRRSCLSYQIFPLALSLAVIANSSLILQGLLLSRMLLLAVEVLLVFNLGSGGLIRTQLSHLLRFHLSGKVSLCCRSSPRAQVADLRLVML